MNVASYTDDYISYGYDADINSFTNKLEDCVTNLSKWLKENHLKANGEDCHLLVTANKPTSINIKGNNITSGQKESLLGIKLDSTLSLENHVANFCKKIIQELYTLATVLSCMDFDRWKCLMKAFIMSQFNYSLLGGVHMEVSWPG